MSENAHHRIAGVLSDLPLLSRYFRDSPRLSWRVFVWRPIKHASVCSWRGHTEGGNVSRLLGLCGRCHQPLRTLDEIRADQEAGR